MKLARLRGPVALWSVLALCPLPFAAVAAGVDADALVGT